MMVGSHFGQDCFSRHITGAVLKQKPHARILKMVLAGRSPNLFVSLPSVATLNKTLLDVLYYYSFS